MPAALAWIGTAILAVVAAMLWAIDIACWDVMPGTAECAYRLALHFPTW